MHHNLQQVNESRFEENPSSSIQDDSGVQQQRRQYDKVDNEEQFQLSSRQPSDTQFIPMKNPSHAQPGQQTLQGQEYRQQDSQRDEELIKKLRAAVNSSKDSAVTSSQNNSGIDDDGLNTWSIGETVSTESAAATRTNGVHVQSAQLTAANKSVHAQSEEEVLQAEYIRLQFKLYGGPHQAFPVKANAELVEMMKAALESQERTRSATNTQANVSTSGMWGRSIETTTNSRHLPGQTFSQTSTPGSPHYHRPGMPTPPRAEHRNGAEQIETLKQRLPHSTNSVSHYVPVVMQPHKLPNGTQNCFMNASLQCCLAMLELNKLLTDSFLHTHATNDGTVHFYRDLCEGFTTKAHTSFTNHAWQWFKNRRQQDVDEFTGELFDAFKQHMQNVDSNTTDLGGNYFENRLISVLCVKESVTRNILEQNSQKLYSSEECTYPILRLTMSDSTTCLTDCIKKHYSASLIDGLKYNGNIHSLLEQRSITDLPTYLSISLRRHVSADGQQVSYASVQFSLTLNLEEFLHPKQKNIPSQYRLKGVIFFTGEDNSGHFFSCIHNRDDKLWYYCNDDTIEKLSEPSIMSESARSGSWLGHKHGGVPVMFFYERQDSHSLQKQYDDQAPSVDKVATRDNRSDSTSVPVHRAQQPIVSKNRSRASSTIDFASPSVTEKQPANVAQPMRSAAPTHVLPNQNNQYNDSVPSQSQWDLRAGQNAYDTTQKATSTADQDHNQALSSVNVAQLVRSAAPTHVLPNQNNQYNDSVPSQSQWDLRAGQNAYDTTQKATSTADRAEQSAEENSLPSPESSAQSDTSELLPKTPGNKKSAKKMGLDLRAYDPEKDKPMVGESNPYDKTSGPNSELFAAVWEGDYCKVSQTIAQSRGEWMRTKDGGDNTLLHIAASRNHLPICDLLTNVVKGSLTTIVAINKCGETPLHVAVKTARWEVLKKLLEVLKEYHKANNDNNETILKSIHPIKLKKSDPLPPLHLAAYNGRMGAVKYLLDDIRKLCSGVGNNMWRQIIEQKIGKQGYTLLHVACLSGSSKTVHLVLNEMKSLSLSPYIEDAEHRTPLLLAVARNASHLIRKLIEAEQMYCDTHSDRSESSNRAKNIVAAQALAKRLEYQACTLQLEEHREHKKTWSADSRTEDASHKNPTTPRNRQKADAQRSKSRASRQATHKKSNSLPASPRRHRRHSRQVTFSEDSNKVINDDTVRGSVHGSEDSDGSIVTQEDKVEKEKVVSQPEDPQKEKVVSQPEDPQKKKGFKARVKKMFGSKEKKS